jgi:transcriptional regulator with XRE-family HTH domain
LPRNKRGLLKEAGARIRQVRLALGLSQAELGRRIGGKTASAISKYEAGHINEIRVLIALSEALEKPVDWLIFGEQARSPQAVPGPLSSPPELLRGLLALFEAEAVAHLLPRFRERYNERAKEVVARAQREIEEYRRLLEAESRTGRQRQKMAKSPPSKAPAPSP